MSKKRNYLAPSLIICTVFSGVFKSIFTSFNISFPIDLTFAFTILSIISTILFNFKVPVFKDFKPKLIIFLVILLFILITISITWTPSVDYYSVKYRNSILNFIIFFLVIFSKNRISTYINLFLIIGTILSSIFLLIIHPNIYSNELYYSVRSNNLMCSLITGVNILFLTISKNQLFFKKRTLNLLLILNIILVFVSSSRGAIISVLIVLIISIINKKTLKRITLRGTFYLAVLLITSVISLNILNKSFDVAFQNPIERTILKLELLLDEDKGESINSRVLHFNNFKNFLGGNVLFGHGFGSYGLVYKGIDGRLYPHNILIEIWMECGLLAFFTLTLIMILTIYSKNIFQTRFNLIVLFITLNLLKSFNFGDIRLFFFMIAMYLLNYARKENEKKYLFNN